MTNTLELKGGRVLRLRPVRPSAMRHLLMQFGSADVLTDPDKLLALSGKAQWAALEATERLFTYVAGWGVEDDPTEEELSTLAELGYSTDKPHLARANWLRYLVLEDDDEMSDLLAAVMGLSVAGTEEGPEQVEDGA